VKTLVRLFILVVLIALAVPLPAIQIPQTRREFVEAVAGGARSVKMETFVVERSLGEVYAILQKRVMKCLDVEVKRSGFVGNQYGGQLVRLQPDLEEGRGGQGRVLAAGRAPAARHRTDDPARGSLHHGRRRPVDGQGADGGRAVPSDDGLQGPDTHPQAVDRG